MIGDAVGGLYGQAPAVRALVLEAVTGGPGCRGAEDVTAVISAPASQEWRMSF
ncbi:hypothetical protein [Streptosporangium subroseum]|uniref:hypothetical protein n=1 Tax=Streptosporangium subroseum TaxID=106412 RepID=UPI003084A8C6|nr:hypothetical protein OHB15_19810 [Streptosporangium subroseum]